jgi:hypothetical protein
MTIEEPRSMNWPVCVLIAALLTVTGCSDNAVRLRFGLEAAAKRLAAAPDLTEASVVYAPPGDSPRNYWIVFFPARVTSAEELVSRGMPRPVAEKIFRDLANVGGGAALLVIQQEGERMTFTRYDGEANISVENLIAEYRDGPSEVLLRKQRGSVYVVGVR